MKVILKQAVPKVGKAGQLVKVKPGFARNFLFPKGMAVVADKGQIRALEARNARDASKLAETLAGAQAIAAKINGKTLRMEVKVGEGGRLFGAVTSQDIADQINKEFGVNIDKKDVALLLPIKRTGKYPIEIDMHRDVAMHMNVAVVDPTAEVVAEEEPVEAPAVAEAPEAEAATEEA